MFYNNKKNILYNILNNKNIIICVLITLILVMLILDTNKIYEGNTDCTNISTIQASYTDNSQLETCTHENSTSSQDNTQTFEDKITNNSILVNKSYEDKSACNDIQQNTSHSV